MQRRGGMPPHWLRTAGPPCRDRASEIEAMCTGLRSDLARLDPQPPMEKVLEACAQRMPESVCRKCLRRR